jgi:hypothetical protein
MDGAGLSLLSSSTDRSNPKIHPDDHTERLELHYLGPFSFAPSARGLIH